MQNRVLKEKHIPKSEFGNEMRNVILSLCRKLVSVLFQNLTYEEHTPLITSWGGEILPPLLVREGWGGIETAGKRCPTSARCWTFETESYQPSEFLRTSSSKVNFLTGKKNTIPARASCPRFSNIFIQLMGCS